MNNLGYTKSLFILPFDHRSSFEKGMFGIQDRQPSPDEVKRIIEVKKIIYEAFKKSVSSDVSEEEAAILVDEQYGDEILRDAKKNGFVALLTTEKSGQKEFAFEFGKDFGKHIDKYKPTFAKALIRYNPKDDEQSKIRQQKNLKILSDFCHKKNYKFLLEVLIPPRNNTSEESPSQHLRGDRRAPRRWTLKRYDKEIRPKLAVNVIEELQNAGIEPDVWKLEGMTKVKDYEAVVKQVKSGQRSNVGVVVLGRGADQKQVEEWILVGATVKGVIGLAVGRTVFWQPLIDLINGKIAKEKAIGTISDNFLHFCEIFAANSYSK